MKQAGSLLLLLWIFFPGIYAQNLESHLTRDFHLLTVEDGLSQNTVNCILKDRYGYMWFGTRSGLNRFDSYEVEQVISTGEGLDEFTNLDFYDLYEDQDGHIWIGSNNGLYCYDPSFESVDICKFFPERTSVFCIEPESDSLLWIGTSEGLFLVDIRTGVREEFTHKPYQTNTLSNSIVYSLKNDDEVLWIGTAEGLNSFHKKSRSFNQLLHSGQANFLAGKRVSSILKARDGKIWLGIEYGGLASYQPESNQFRTFSTANSALPHNDVREIQENDDGNLWLAINGSGLCLFDVNTEEVTLFQHDPSNPRSLSNNSAYSVLLDREGILWVGTFAYGVNYAAAKPGTFKYIYHQPGKPNSVCESKIRSVYQDRGSNLWMGTWGGLSRLDAHSSDFTSYVAEKDNSESLSFNTVTTIFEDSKGRIWVGTYSGGLNLFNKEKGTFQHFKHQSGDPSSLSSNQVYCIAEGQDHTLWIATISGLNRYIEESGDFESYNNHDIRDIHVNSDGNLVLAVLGGVALFNVHTNSFNFFENEKISPYQLLFVTKGSDGRLWFGTQGGGMGYYDMDSDTYKLYSVKEGLPSNHVSACIQISDSILWISTYKGLAQFNTRSEEFRVFGIADGLPGYEFFPRSASRLLDGNLAFGSSKGLVFFHPDSLDAVMLAPEVLLSNLKINNNPVPIGTKESPLSRSLSETDRISLKHSEKDFMIDYVALNFKIPGKNNYAYTLDNYLLEWRQVGETRSIGFTNLDPGEYCFRVRACNENAGTNQSPEATLQIKILPPFWWTWWFLGCIVLVLILLVIGYKEYSFISNKQKRVLALQKLEYEKQEKFVNMKLRFFSNISHEFRTPLTLILDPLHKLLKKDNDPETGRLLVLMERSTKRLIRLIDQILDFRKVEADALQLRVREIDMISCIRGIYDSFSEKAESSQIEYRMFCEMEHLFGWLDDDKVEKILYNILSNAFKFTPHGGRITIRLGAMALDDSFITFSVTDTGKGISQERIPRIFDRFYTEQRPSKISSAGAGIGLAMVKKMVDLHRGSVDVESEQGKGTTFIFTLPIAKKYYTEEERIQYDVRDTEMLLPVMSADSEVEPLSVRESEEMSLVMVVEDDEDIRDYLEHILSPFFRVVSGSNGKEGLALLKESHPDLILSDTVMPVMNGIEMCKIIKSEEETALIPFLFLSVWSSDDFKLKGLHTGADDYITKQFSSDVLIAKIKNTIEFRKRFKDLSMSKIEIMPGKIQLDSMQTIFINNVQTILEQHVGDLNFNSKRFREEMNMSHSLLYRNLKSLTGLSSNELIRDYRLKRAAQILKMDTGLSISEVGFKVGFIDSKYFSQCFKKKYGTIPSVYSSQEIIEKEGSREQFEVDIEQLATRTQIPE